MVPQDAKEPGIRLPTGVYEIEVSHPGYVTQKASAKIAENDVTLLIDLEKARYALAIDVDPPQSRISVANTLNIQKPYQPGMKLETGVYQLEITCPGYRTERTTITITDADVSVVLKLESQSDSLVAPGGLTPTQTLQPHPTVRPPAKSTKPRSTRSVAANPPTKKPKAEGAGVGNRTNWPNQGANVGNRANQSNQPAQEGGAFKRALRQFRDDFKRAFW